MYCPTESMVADYFTKPLQGKLFHKLRDMTMGVDMKDLESYQRCFDEVIARYEELKKESKAA